MRKNIKENNVVCHEFRQSDLPLKQEVLSPLGLFKKRWLLSGISLYFKGDPDLSPQQVQPMTIDRNKIPTSCSHSLLPFEE